MLTCKHIDSYYSTVALGNCYFFLAWNTWHTKCKVTAWKVSKKRHGLESEYVDIVVHLTPQSNSLRNSMNDTAWTTRQLAEFPSSYMIRRVNKTLCSHFWLQQYKNNGQISKTSSIFLKFFIKKKMTTSNISFKTRLPSIFPIPSKTVLALVCWYRNN